eukprot:14634111-Ditylum_brightwellii.AAC.1
MLHNIDKIGSPIPILGELSKIVVLLGFKDDAVPATVGVTSLLETTEEKVPKIDFLLALKDDKKYSNRWKALRRRLKRRFAIR